MQYYGAFYRSAMCQLLSRINAYLVRWIRKKYKRLRAEKKAIERWRESPNGILACSRTGYGFRRLRVSGEQDGKNPVTGMSRQDLWQPAGEIPAGHPTA